MESSEVIREFGQWLKQKREESHLSQGGAAQRAGIDRQQWYRIENGLSGTRRDTVIAIARALSLPVEEALNRAGFAMPTDGFENEDGMFSGLDRYPAEQQEWIRETIRKQARVLIESLPDPEPH